MEKEKSCPKCSERMRRVWKGSQLPNVPFVSIPSWARRVAIYTCGGCGYMELWAE